MTSGRHGLSACCRFYNRLAELFCRQFSDLLRSKNDFFLVRCYFFYGKIWWLHKKSIPLQPLTRVRAFSSAGLEHLPYKQRVGGSNPSTPTSKGFNVFGILKPFNFFPLCLSSFHFQLWQVADTLTGSYEELVLPKTVRGQKDCFAWTKT